MTKLPSLTGKQLVAALSSLGFQVVRTRGSHQFLRHADGRATVVPIHAGETIGKGLLSRILRDCEISRDALLSAL
jgi:predicted RNA binding protein YcfA (HicA-like mRNA interferase family)